MYNFNILRYTEPCVGMDIYYKFEFGKDKDKTGNSANTFRIIGEMEEPIYFIANGDRMIVDLSFCYSDRSKNCDGDQTDPGLSVSGFSIAKIKTGAELQSTPFPITTMPPTTTPSPQITTADPTTVCPKVNDTCTCRQQSNNICEYDQKEMNCVEKENSEYKITQNEQLAY